MSRQRRRHAAHSLRPVVLLLAFGMLLWTLARPAWSDDRDLLRQSAGNPYVFVILDTSGSMNEVALQSGVPALAGGDGKDSKLYGAKQALYEVMTQFSNISYGFGTFNQDHLRVFRKHWIYKPDVDPSWSATLPYPIKGQGYAFGGGGTSSPDVNIQPTTSTAISGVGSTCLSPMTLPAAPATAPSTAYRLLVSYPRTGELGDKTFSAWLRSGGRTYFVETKLANGSKLGDASITVAWQRRRVSTGAGKGCGASPPNDFDAADTVAFYNVTYTLVTDALLPETTILNDKVASNVCAGFEPNTDTTSDTYVITGPPSVTVNVKYPTVANPSFAGPPFNEGDFLPLSWTKDNKDEVTYRLAPNLRPPLNEGAPDYRVARYFKDSITGNATSFALELKDPSIRPLVGEGTTPLTATLQGYRTWYESWAPTAAQNDPSWACRRKYVILLTDGDETCTTKDASGNFDVTGACAAAAALKGSDNVVIYVIGFGLATGTGNALKCIASNGGSGVPVYPQDESALLVELKKIFGAIQEDNRAFASAAVPAVETDVQDKIYLSNFTPIDLKGYWDGHLDAYLKPLPLTAAGLPNKTLNCTSTLTNGCHLWDAGKKILDLAPSSSDLGSTPPNFQIGGGTNQRRVFYTKAQATTSVPMVTKLLLPQTSDDDKQDLFTGLNLSPIPAKTDTVGVAAADAKVIKILKATYGTKTDTITDSTGATSTITFLLDDIFHSNPLVVSSPSRSRYYNLNLYSKNQTCTSGDPGYKCFALKHEFRRKMLVVGDNDQQLHIFDAGIYDSSAVPPAFGNGTGYELYSLVPRPLLPNLLTLSPDTAQVWGVDGTPQVDDVFIDPSHTGIPDDNPGDTVREWRTVVVGGFREGGSGYVAVDVTQPDLLNSNRVPQPTSGWVPSCWNSTSVTDCGTIPFGSVLWTFTDTQDADGNGFPDLGQTWSSPTMGRILVKTTDTPPQLLDKYVAIFGGGMDPNNLNRQGNFLYMVDIETGKAIYKRQLGGTGLLDPAGSAPSDPAAVDTDQDGYIDTIYIGTTAGFLYKVDIHSAGTFAKDTVTGDWKITDTAWEPFKIFDTLQADTGKRGPIFFPPSVVFVAQLGKYALAFGTGNRWNLWAKDATPGRLYVILDDNFATGVTPKDESKYENITLFNQSPTGSNFLLTPNGSNLPGWYLKLGTEERMITKPFTLSGLSIFTSYDPTFSVVGAVCARSGTSRIFTVFTTTGDGVCRDDSQCTDPTNPPPRSVDKSDFVTTPFVETSATKNPPCNAAQDPNCAPTAPPLCANLSSVTKTLMGLFPNNCQFASFTQDIKTIQSDNGIVCIAPVPVCIIRKNWKEN
ncbi:MAG TPA: PilC/PilY family type IV pilus protein [Thermoanaerobaculia bacterium]|nr:PilC/PilY family type IV pilus protein [Thermoanaerobaculia bacterium]